MNFNQSVRVRLCVCDIEREQQRKVERDICIEINKERQNIISTYIEQTEEVHQKIKYFSPTKLMSKIDKQNL